MARIAHLSGWLHDIGYLVLAQERSEPVVRALRRFHDASPRGAGENWCAHADIGAYLVGLWGLPDPMVEPIAYHHQPAAVQRPEFTALTAVHVAKRSTLDETSPVHPAPSISNTSTASAVASGSMRGGPTAATPS